MTTDPIPDRTLWLRPEKVALAIEVVSTGSERTDRFHKPIEYAIVRIPRFWRVDLLAGEVPDLS